MASSAIASAPAPGLLAVDNDGTGAPAGAAPIAPRKFKASDLPLTSATRSAIESLAHSFKKKGGYDAIRKEVWEKFEASVSSPSASMPEQGRLRG